MLAIRPSSPGGPEQLVLADVASRSPGPGEARVRVAYAGVNFIDVYHRTGLYPLPSPIPIGQEGAGVVEEVGAGVDLAVGKRVGYGLFGIAVVLFFVGIVAQFTDAMAAAIVACLVVGSSVLAPAIVFGYAVRAAEREDRA
jgi:NADPH:quinone reductase-like Zn-dependent oxidoreductase